MAPKSSVSNNLDELDFAETVAGEDRALHLAFSRVFGRGRPVAQWRAIYQDCPDGALSWTARTATNQVVAHYGTTLHQAQCALPGLERIYVMQTRDTFTDPAWRGRGLGQFALVNRTLEGLLEATRERWAPPIGFGYTSARHYRLGRLVMGYHRLETMQLLSTRFAAFPGEPPAAHGWMRPVGDHEPGFDGLWEERRKHYGLCVARDSRFLAWRFGAQLGRGARLFAYWSPLRPYPMGYAALRQDGGRWLLLDVALPPGQHLLRDFWSQLSAWVGWTPGEALETWCCTSDPQYPAWLALGFAAGAFSDEFVPTFRLLDERLEKTWVDSQLTMTMADADFI